jgi:hypothetical protein
MMKMPDTISRRPKDIYGETPDLLYKEYLAGQEDRK